ncbi:MAG: SRPBCC family protein [Lentimicrobiaceae bacterium]|nr:SRPBCC family protein [Lentimicrobiaceae bacterium]
MTTLQSDIQLINAPAEKTFNYLSDFNHFSNLMPPQITNWKSTTDSCSFTIQGMADIAMQTKEKHPYSKIVISSGIQSKLAFDLIISLTENDNSQTQSCLTFEASLNPMMNMMLSKPLTNFINILNQQIKLVCERL